MGQPTPTMGQPTPTMAELSKSAVKALQQRMETAEKLLKDSAIVRDQLIKLGWLSDRDAN